MITEKLIKDLPRWVEEYGKRGIFMFTPQKIVLLQTVQKKYEKDYKRYILALEKSFQTKEGLISPIYNELQITISDVIQEIDNANLGINKIITGKASVQDVETTFKSIKIIENIFPYLGRLAAEDTNLKTKLENIQAITGLSLEGLGTTGTAIRKQFEGLKTPKTIEERFAGIKTRHPELYGLGKEMLGGIIEAFGPYGTAAKWMGTTITRYLKRRKEARLEREAGTLAQQLLPAELTTPERAAGLKEALIGGIPTPRAVRPEELIRKKTGPEVTAGSQSLYQFFNEGAYRAKWTKEILGLFGGGLAKPTGKKGGLAGFFDKFKGLLENISGMFKTLGPILLNVAKIAGPALAIAGAGLAGWAAGRWVGKHVKVGGKSVDEWVQKGFQKLMGGDERDRLKREAALAKRPEMKRALELQAQGMGVKESVTVAQAEISGKPTTKISEVAKPGIKKVIPEEIPITESIEQLTEEQRKARLAYKYSPEELKLASERERLTATAEYKKKGIKIYGGLPVMGELTEEQQIFVRKKEEELRTKTMERENKAAEYNAQMLEEMKNLNKNIQTQKVKPSYDAKDTGDPLIESLNQGNLATN